MYRGILLGIFTVFNSKAGFDFIAASFVRKVSDVLAIREVLERNNKTDIQIISKIENQEGIDNIDSIAHTTSVEITTPTTSIVDAVAENQPQTLAESIETSESLADKLAKTADDTLAEAINNKKIIDLKSSITLGDRFRFQRELFGGNGEKMNKAISDFNSFETMAEAQSYIAKNFDWPLDNDAVSDFIQLLQRRYL